MATPFFGPAAQIPNEVSRFSGQEQLQGLMESQVNAINQRRETQLESFIQAETMRRANEMRRGQMELAAKLEAESSVKRAESMIDALEGDLFQRTMGLARKFNSKDDVGGAARHLQQARKQLEIFKERGVGIPEGASPGIPPIGMGHMAGGDFILQMPMGGAPIQPSPNMNMPPAPSPAGSGVSMPPSSPTSPTGGLPAGTSLPGTDGSATGFTDAQLGLALFGAAFGGGSPLSSLSQLQQQTFQQQEASRQRQIQTMLAQHLAGGGSIDDNTGKALGVLLGQAPPTRLEESTTNLALAGASQAAVQSSLSQIGIDPNLDFESLDADQIKDVLTTARSSLSTLISDLAGQLGSEQKAKAALRPIFVGLLSRASRAARSQIFEAVDRPRALERVKQIQEILGITSLPR